jgi:hypothetical protein
MEQLPMLSWLSQGKKRRAHETPMAKHQRRPWHPVLELLEDRTLLSSAWAPLANSAPSSTGTGTMMLLTDGTVMVQGGGTTNTWYQLTPNASGNYTKGTWGTLPSMNTPRLYFASNVLTDGRVFVLGGEYTNAGQVFTNTGEIFDPAAGTWTKTAHFPKSQFGDDPSQLLPDGRVFVGYLSGAATYIYDPAANTWSFAANKRRTDQCDEEGWVKLPDGSILSYDIWASISSGTNTAQRYVPSSNSWADAGTLPVALSGSAVGDELGPNFLLPDGRAFFIGATNQTALYTPSSNSWVAGPSLPSGMGADDAPGVMLPNGHVLFAADTPLFHGPTQIFDFDPVASTITQVTTPTALTNALTGPSYTCRMLMLPNGKVLFTDGGDKLWVYTPTGGPQSSWRPKISSVVNNGDGTYTLTGTQLNGLSEGAAYGDDAEMSSNYPIVRLKNSAGQIFYARTSGWSNTGVATGTTSETVNFTLPSGLPSGAYSLYAVANGIASAAFSFTAPGAGRGARSAAGSGATPSAGLDAAQVAVASAQAGIAGPANGVNRGPSALVSAEQATSGAAANAPLTSAGFAWGIAAARPGAAPLAGLSLKAVRPSAAADLVFADPGWAEALGAEGPG